MSLSSSMENPTLVILTDRNDLDDQLFTTFSSCIDLLRQNPVQAENRGHLQKLLQVASGGIVFTTIQKFPRISETINELPNRSFGIIVDEVHSSQSGESSKHLKKSLSKGEEDEIDEDEEYSDVDRKILDEIRSRGKKENISLSETSE